MGRAAKFKKGQLIRRKAKSKSIKSSTNNNHHQPTPTKSTVTKDPNHEQIINWLQDPELHDWIYQLWEKKITFDLITQMLKFLTNQILKDSNYKDDYTCDTTHEDYAIGVNTVSWTLWISLIKYNMNQVILDAPDWKKTPFDF
ncbi:MAG: hypothetical protein WBM32_15140 [Crocosphaera sp.]